MSFDLAGIAALILSLIAIIKMFWPGPSQAKKDKLDAYKQLEEMVDNTINKNLDLQRLVMTQNTKFDREMGTLRKDLAETICILSEWYEGVQRLLAQIRKSKANPVWEPDLERLNYLKEKYEKYEDEPEE